MPPSYQLNHPKAYIGYTVAQAYSSSQQAVEALTESYVTNGVGMARRGAQQLGLVTLDDTPSLTDRGEWVAKNATDWFEADTLAGVLETFDEMRGARERFVERFPAFEKTGPTIAHGDAELAQFIELTQNAHERRLERGYSYGITTSTLFRTFWREGPDYRPFTVRMFLRDDDAVHEEILGSTDPEDWRTTSTSEMDLLALYDNELADGTSPVYRSATMYQLKNLGWHLGVFQWKGTQASDLDPEEMKWALESPDVYQPMSVAESTAQQTAGGEF